MRCEQLGNLIFINFNEHASALTKHIDDINELMAGILYERVKLYTIFSWSFETNWKFGQDAFSETYHAHFGHAQNANDTSTYSSLLTTCFIKAIH